MRVNVNELRNMIAAAVGLTLEKKGKGKKEMPEQSPESEAEQRERMSRGTPGYELSSANDFSKPLGKHSLTKRQGASGMGGWTSESRRLHEEDEKTASIIQMLVQNGVDPDKAPGVAQQLAAKMQPTPMQPTGGDTGLDDPSQLGIEASMAERVQRRVYEMQVRRLVRMVVAEELAARR